MIPIWNDLWFPLLLAPGNDTQTITLGIQQFIGQYITDWNSVLAALSVAIIPVLITQLEQNTIDWKAIGIVGAIAFLRALDSFVREWDGTSLQGITPMQ